MVSVKKILNNLRLFWNVKYQCDATPDLASPAWAIVADEGTISANGVLSINSDDAYWRLEDANLVIADGVTVEAKIKVVSGSAIADDNFNQGFSIYGDTHYTDCLVYTDGVVLYGADGNSTPYMMDTSDYHVYRLTVNATESKLYVDGVLRITTTPYEDSQVTPYVDIYGAGGAVAVTEWDYVYIKYGIDQDGGEQAPVFDLSKCGKCSLLFSLTSEESITGSCDWVAEHKVGDEWYATEDLVLDSADQSINTLVSLGGFLLQINPKFALSEVRLSASVNDDTDLAVNAYLLSDELKSYN